MSVQLSDITINFAARTLFSGLTLPIGEKSRIGLIGRNGCGKSTLLKIIMGIHKANEGSIYRAPGVRVNYLSQEPRITPTLTLAEEMRTVFTELNALAAEETVLLEKLNRPGATDEDLMHWATRLSDLHAELDRLGAGDADARMGRILKGLGFEMADYDRKIGEFSGGWQMRINLAKVLLEGADIILMDEPTNHLDLEACEWLESFLREYPGGIVVVSHDRRFLDQVTTETAEIELGKLKLWPANYSKHLELKAAEIEILESAADRQEKELAKQSAFVERFKASATRSTQAKSRERQLAKVERIEVPQQDHRKMKFEIPPPEASGHQVMTIKDVGKAFGDKKLFPALNAEMQRGQRVFLLGANGTGKTTLLRLILGLEKPDTGAIKMGHNVNIGYFSQNQLDTLDPNISVLDTLQLICPLKTNTELRTLLGRFLFTGDQVFKPVSVLSGGEKSKVALAKLMLSGPNTLLLDEPTNHMDIPSKDVMAAALQEYAGSILCISHDRAFIQDLATNIWELYRGRLLAYNGDYDYYLFKREQMHALADADIARIEELAAKQAERDAKKAQQEPKPAANTAEAVVNTVQLKKETEKRIKKAERSILALETELAALQTEQLKPELQSDYDTLNRVAKEIEDKQKELASVNTEWEQLAETMAALGES